jgi:hypothetical protein
LDEAFDRRGLYLYVSDYGNDRLSRFDLWEGTSKGWVGTVRFKPDSGTSGCATTNAPKSTRGWCVAGAAG